MSSVFTSNSLYYFLKVLANGLEACIHVANGWYCARRHHREGLKVHFWLKMVSALFFLTNGVDIVFEVLRWKLATEMPQSAFSIFNSPKAVSSKLDRRTFQVMQEYPQTLDKPIPIECSLLIASYVLKLLELLLYQGGIVIYAWVLFQRVAIFNWKHPWVVHFARIWFVLSVFLNTLVDLGLSSLIYSPFEIFPPLQQNESLLWIAIMSIFLHNLLFNVSVNGFVLLMVFNSIKMFPLSLDLKQSEGKSSNRNTHLNQPGANGVIKLAECYRNSFGLSPNRMSMPFETKSKHASLPFLNSIAPDKVYLPSSPKSYSSTVLDSNRDIHPSVHTSTSKTPLSNCLNQIQDNSTYRTENLTTHEPIHSAYKKFRLMLISSFCVCCIGIALVPFRHNKITTPLSVVALIIPQLLFAIHFSFEIGFQYFLSHLLKAVRIY